MSTLDDWITDASHSLALPADAIPPDLRDALLSLTRDVAHDVARIAGPLTCYLAGLAVGHGAASTQVVQSLGDLVRSRAPRPDTDPTADTPQDPATPRATTELSPGAAS